LSRARTSIGVGGCDCPPSRGTQRRRERGFNHVKTFRRVATRYEKLAVNFLTMVTIAAILIWL
jgi:transposase